jgi:hypothetical protein
MSARRYIDDSEPDDMWEDALWGMGLIVGTIALLILSIAAFGR